MNPEGEEVNTSDPVASSIVHASFVAKILVSQMVMRFLKANVCQVPKVMQIKCDHKDYKLGLNCNIHLLTLSK